jgi:hypothetical protein
VVVMVAATVALARSAAQASDRLRLTGAPG